MYRFDYHLHTCHSMDANTPVAEMCEAAVRVGLDEICITDHTEFGHPDPRSDIPPVVERWLADIEAAKDKYPALTIRVGIEIGDNPLCRDRIKEWHFALPLDFRLLSLHLIDNEDPYFPEFFANKTQEAFYRRYVESKLESVLAWAPDTYDAVAHLGYCAKFAPYPMEERPLRYQHAPDAFDTLFHHMALHGKALEINTSGRRSMGEFIPDRELLARFQEAGGEFVTIGSDAHRPEHVGNWIDDARELAKECGLRYGLTFQERRPVPILL
ncbi:histidinol-phosphatase HisJ family protein [Eubacteriales bacterium OttesenSCG-928-A19]|nr:histidinol-phosphatase HisJ family protein [Eubacteriales bacterium OttesenSCG-928-A19]